MSVRYNTRWMNGKEGMTRNIEGDTQGDCQLGYPIERRYHGGWRTAVLFDIGYPLLVFTLVFAFGV